MAHWEERSRPTAVGLFPKQRYQPTIRVQNSFHQRRTRKANSEWREFPSIEKKVVIVIEHPGFFREEVADVIVQSGLLSEYGALSLESCKAGRCNPWLKQVRITPACE
jgi:hypothetical protein